jgi:L-alanine-DL-glutamate epimerase-like enolase superfamily enzyme
MKRQLDILIEEWPLSRPFQITGHLFTACKVVVVHVSIGPHVGRGEAAGVYYHGDTPDRIATEIAAVRSRIENGATRDEIGELLPPGGARNALDCALWDLEAQQTCRPVWEIAGLPPPRKLLTTFTVSAGEPAEMAAAARAFSGARAIKLKLLGDGGDDARIRAVRAACPEIYLAVDANQGFKRATLDALWTTLLACKVQLVEQPYKVGQESLLDGYERPIPIAADESALALPDVARLCGRFDVVNIKLDKCGGLTEGLRIAQKARELGIRVMVGNMTGTSLAMAPAFVLGQLCDIVDLDGPALLAQDRVPGVAYEDGFISITDVFWGRVVV